MDIPFQDPSALEAFCQPFIRGEKRPQTADKGGPEDSEGQVEFIARYAMDGTEHVHREKSQFRRIDGRWYFSNGQKVGATTIRNEGPKIGRNDPCSCGSGKKYKKCHGA